MKYNIIESITRTVRLIIKPMIDNHCDNVMLRNAITSYLSQIRNNGIITSYSQIQLENCKNTLIDYIQGEYSPGDLCIDSDDTIKGIVIFSDGQGLCQVLNSLNEFAKKIKITFMLTLPNKFEVFTISIKT